MAEFEMPDAPRRRSADHLQEQIEDLIVAAAEPKDKAFLLIMNKIATSLDMNTTLTRALANDFKVHTEAFGEHERKEMELINQGRGGFRVALALLGVLQIIVGYVISGSVTELKTLRQDMTVVQRDMATHKERHTQEERFLREQGKLPPKVGP